MEAGFSPDIVELEELKWMASDRGGLSGKRRDLTSFVNDMLKEKWIVQVQQDRRCNWELYCTVYYNLSFDKDMKSFLV